MPTRPNPLKDAFFLRLIQEGLIVCSREGVITNTKTERKIGALNSSQYISVSWKDVTDGKIKVGLAQRIIWLFFHGSIPPDYVINHIDGDKLNNRLENLETITEAENRQHAVDNRLHTHGENFRDAVLTEKQAQEILDTPRTVTHVELAKKFGVHVTTIGGLRRGRFWKHLKRQE